MSVKEFQRGFGRKGQHYPCFYNSKKPDEVVTTTGDFKMVIVHCILWPLLLFFSMVGVMVGMYLYRRQSSPNDGQEVHLVWD